MSRRAARSKLCPTPSKGRHLTEGDAIAVAERRQRERAMARLPITPLYVYRCDCRWWHLTGNAYSRDGIRHRGVTA